MKKKIIMLAVNLLPGILWQLWYFCVENEHNSFTLIYANVASYFGAILFLIINAVFTKEYKWYFIYGAMAVVGNSLGCYFATIGYLKYTNTLLMLGMQADSVSVLVAFQIVALIMIYATKKFILAYEKLFKSLR